MVVYVVSVEGKCFNCIIYVGLVKKFITTQSTSLLSCMVGSKSLGSFFPLLPCVVGSKSLGSFFHLLPCVVGSKSLCSFFPLLPCVVGAKSLGSFFPLLPCVVGPSHLVASSTFVVNYPHLPLSSVMVFHSWLFVPALWRSRLTQSFHRSFCLPLLLLPPSSAFHALFDRLSSPILCTCPAHLILLPTTVIFNSANTSTQFDTLNFNTDL